MRSIPSKGYERVITSALGKGKLLLDAWGYQEAECRSVFTAVWNFEAVIDHMIGRQDHESIYTPKEGTFGKPLRDSG